MSVYEQSKKSGKRVFKMLRVLSLDGGIIGEFYFSSVNPIYSVIQIHASGLLYRCKSGSRTF